MFKIFKRLSAPRIIALGFLGVILLGSAVLMLPFCLKEGVTLKYIDSLYTSTSAVCVTGLVAVDTADTFTVIGQIVIALLIQIGGLGVASVGAGVILAMRKKIDIKGINVIREASNLSSGKGTMGFIKNVFFTTLVFELAGAVLSFLVFSRDFPPPKAIWVSIFHSVATFNNAGFDILGNFQNLAGYKDSVLLNIVTSVLIFFGGIGFLTIREMTDKKFRRKKFSMHSKVVISVSLALILIGTVLIKLNEDITWLGAFFSSVTARTAGFSTYSLGEFSNAGLIVMLLLMFIGSSPGSTGGGVKTSTFFVLIQGIKSAATNKSEKAFKYSIPSNAFRKAAVIVLMGIAVILSGTYIFSLLEPNIPFIDALFEMTSAFATVGLSTGISPTLSFGAKLLTVFIMYIGRLGPLTVATLWYFNKGERIRYPDGNIAIG